MKAIVSCLFLFFFLALDAQKEISPETNIKEITVFLQGAQVTRSGSIQLPAGKSKVVLSGLSRYLNNESIQVKGKGNFTIFSVNHRINYLKNLDKPKEILVLEDSLELLNNQLDEKNVYLNALQQEEQMIMANKSLGGENTGVSVTELRTASAFFREKINEIGLQKINTNQNVKEIKEDIEKINNQLNQMNALRDQPMSEIVVTVDASRTGQASFEASYFVSRAGWVPSYELRATNTEEPVDLVYNGNVFQTTGENWDNVLLTLSTGNPVLSGTKPDLRPWHLRFFTPRTYDTRTKSARISEMEAPEALEDVAQVSYGEATYQKAITTEGQTTTEFAIPVYYTIPSDGDQYTVRISDHTLQASFNYYTAPKIDKDAFLLAEISEWENLDLLSGEASLFFEGTYVGSSYINLAEATSDTLQFSLGRDKNIVITREQLKDYTSSQFIGPNKRETIGHEIIVKNTRSETIEIVIEDQVPVSTTREIEVTVEEKSGARYNETTGMLKWEFNLKPSEERKFRFVYEVKYPKDKEVILE